MKMTDKLPGQILELIRQRGPMLGIDIAAHFGIGTDILWNATRKAMNNGILTRVQVKMAGCESRMINKYMLLESNKAIDEQQVIRRAATLGDAPKIPDDAFNFADPFKLSNKVRNVQANIRQ